MSRAGVNNFYNIYYGPDDQRVKTTRSDGSWTIYSGSYEERSNGDKLHYVGSPAGLCAVMVSNASAGTKKVYYVVTDYQGSLTAAIKQDDGAIAWEWSYDAWGRRRNPGKWNDYNVTIDNLGAGGTQLFTRGYTGHEHIDELALINMNGRIYDPRLGRFMSPDNYVQDPFYTQSYNRYSYVLNNPLKYIDPDGNNPWFVLGAMLLFNYAANVVRNGGEFRPWKWDANKTYVNIGVSTNSNFSNYSFYSGQLFSNVNFYVGYNNNYGFGFSITGKYDSPNFYYPARYYTFAEKNTINGINWAREYYGAIISGELNWKYIDGLQPVPIGNNSNGGYRDLSDSKEYPGISIYQNTNKKDLTAITLPGFGIYIGGGFDGRSLKRTMQHEYGHYLDYKYSPDLNYNGMSFTNYYLFIGLPSIFNDATGIGGSHRSYWTEKRANRWAEIWFGNKLDPDFLKMYPTE